MDTAIRPLQVSIGPFARPLVLRLRPAVELTAVPDQRPVVTSIVCPLQVCVVVWTFVGVVAVSVALTAETSAVLQPCATATLVATRAPSTAAATTKRFI